MINMLLCNIFFKYFTIFLPFTWCKTLKVRFLMRKKSPELRKKIRNFNIMALKHQDNITFSLNKKTIVKSGKLGSISVGWDGTMRSTYYAPAQMPKTQSHWSPKAKTTILAQCEQLLSINFLSNTSAQWLGPLGF